MYTFDEKKMTTYQRKTIEIVILILILFIFYLSSTFASIFAIKGGPEKILYRDNIFFCCQ